MMVEISASGSFNLGNAGTLGTTPDNYIIVPTIAQIVGGWPDWSYPYSHPIKYPYTLVFDDQFDGGTVTIADQSPVLARVSIGFFDIGYNGTVSVSTDWANTFSDLAIFVNPSGSGISSVDLDPLTAPIVQGWNNISGATPTGYYGETSGWHEWETFGVSMVPPRGAKFAVPKVKIGAPEGTTQFLTNFSLSEIQLSDIQKYNTTTWTPYPYQYPRALIVKPVPDRMNISVAPTGRDLVLSGATAVSGPFYQGDESTTITTESIFAVGIESQSINVQAGEVYTYSMMYQTDSTAWTMQVEYLDESGLEVSTINSDYTIATGEGWEQLSMTFTIPEGVYSLQVAPVYTLKTTTAGDSISITHVLLEQSNQVNPWFDGNSGTEYTWQSGGTVGASRSYYYENSSVRGQILDRVLTENVPFWLTLIITQFSDLSYVPVNLGTVTGIGTTAEFGFGGYGEGGYSTG